MPRYRDRVVHYDQKAPLFHEYNIEKEIAKINYRQVTLPSGGSIVIDRAEALVAIDINSGKYRDQKNAEETATVTNLQAVEEIMRQLRLRDLGGVIVIDFIDMRYDKNRRKVERALREKLKQDRAKTKMLRMNEFCLLSLTRQRMRSGFSDSVFGNCPHCGGLGKVKTPESLSLDVMRMLQLAVNEPEVERVAVTIGPDVLEYLQNRHRRSLVKLEEKTGKRIELLLGRDQIRDEVKFVCLDGRDRDVHLPALADANVPTSATGP